MSGRLKAHLGALIYSVLPISPALLLIALSGARYGAFRDELYYLSCARQLSWGYVDHPPLCVGLLRLWTFLFSESEFAVRCLSALISLATVVSVMKLTERLGGSRVATTVAGLAVAASPVYRVIGILYSPNTLDPLMWAISAHAWIACLDNRQCWPRWAALGAVLGLTCLNRLSGLWLIGAIAVGTAISGGARVPVSGLAPCLGAIAMLTAPYVCWEIQNRWPTIEFMRNAAANKMNPVSPPQFLITQIIVMNPLGAPVWISGVIEGFRRPEWKAFASAFVAVAVVLILGERSRECYLAPAYVFVIPLGAIYLSDKFGFKICAWLSVAIVAGGLLLGLISLPILPRATLAEVLEALPKPPSADKGRKSVLQGLSDMVGWPEMAQSTSRVWSSLPPAERARSALLAWNYGEASALQEYGQRYGLPRPICGHNQFWLWGPGKWGGQCVVMVGDFPPKILRSFQSVSLAGRVYSAWATPEEASAPIRIARGLKMPVWEFWADIKRFE